MPGFGNGRGRGHGRQGGRMSFGPRLLEPALLALLLKGEVHGYTLLEQVEALGVEYAHPSIVYRFLREMEDVGWISSVWEREQTQGPPRRVYSLTEDGYAALRDWKRQLEQTQTLVARLIEQIELSSQ